MHECILTTQEKKTTTYGLYIRMECPLFLLVKTNQNTGIPIYLAKLSSIFISTVLLGHSFDLWLYYYVTDDYIFPNKSANILWLIFLFSFCVWCICCVLFMCVCLPRQAHVETRD